MSEIEIGAIYAITFWDHCEDGPVLSFTVFGRVRESTRGQVRIACWDYSVENEEAEEENRKMFSIVRAAIIMAQKLVPVTTDKPAESDA